MGSCNPEIDQLKICPMRLEEDEFAPSIKSFFNLLYKNGNANIAFRATINLGITLSANISVTLRGLEGQVQLVFPPYPAKRGHWAFLSEPKSQFDVQIALGKHEHIIPDKVKEAIIGRMRSSIREKVVLPYRYYFKMPLSSTDDDKESPKAKLPKRKIDIEINLPRVLTKKEQEQEKRARQLKAIQEKKEREKKAIEEKLNDSKKDKEDSGKLDFSYETLPEVILTSIDEKHIEALNIEDDDKPEIIADVPLNGPPPITRRGHSNSVLMANNLKNTLLTYTNPRNAKSLDASGDLSWAISIPIESVRKLLGVVISADMQLSPLQYSQQTDTQIQIEDHFKPSSVQNFIQRVIEISSALEILSHNSPAEKKAVKEHVSKYKSTVLSWTKKLNGLYQDYWNILQPRQKLKIIESAISSKQSYWSRRLNYPDSFLYLLLNDNQTFNKKYAIEAIQIPQLIRVRETYQKNFLNEYSEWLKIIDKILLAIREVKDSKEPNNLTTLTILIKECDKKIKKIESKYQKLWKDVRKNLQQHQKAKYFSEECKRNLSDLLQFVSEVYFFGVVSIDASGR